MGKAIFGNSVNPDTIYYLAIYVIVIVVRFFKTHGKTKDRREYFFVGLEFVYSSVGIAILVLTRSEQQSVGAIFTVFCLLLIVAAFLDASDEKFSAAQRFWGHLSIITLVVAGAMYFNQTVLFPDHRNSSQTPMELSYTVAVPYFDMSFRSFIGDKLGTRRLVYIAVVKAKSKADAIALAKKNFWNNSNKDVMPFDPKKAKSTSELLVDSDDIVVSAQ